MTVQELCEYAEIPGCRMDILLAMTDAKNNPENGGTGYFDLCRRLFTSGARWHCDGCT